MGKRVLERVSAPCPAPPGPGFAISLKGGESALRRSLDGEGYFFSVGRALSLRVGRWSRARGFRAKGRRGRRRGGGKGAEGRGHDASATAPVSVSGCALSPGTALAPARESLAFTGGCSTWNGKKKGPGVQPGPFVALRTFRWVQTSVKESREPNRARAATRESGRCSLRHAYGKLPEIIAAEARRT